jgi:succinate dehydrogenase / fumarate reductase flavoprotein subunit
MNVYYTYGRVKGDSEKDEQTIYVRLFYGRNKIQVKASTQLKIAKNGWNFKAGELADVVDASRKNFSPQDLNHFKNIKERLFDIRNHLKNEFRVFMLSREHNAFTQNEWNDWARQQLSNALSSAKSDNESASRTLKKRENIRELVKKSSFALDAKTPEGPIDLKWTNHKNKMKLVAPNNRPKIDVIIVGTGLAGASAAASLGEMGYNVKCFCFQDSPRRAHSIAAQGGINAAKNYQNDGDSIYRLFYDTIKGGDYRSREGNVYRLAEVSVSIIDQCVAQGVPFARDYGGLLDNRSFGGVQVRRTFYAAGQTGQQLLLGAYSALSRQIGLGRVKMYNRHEMMDLVKIDGKARGIITRNLVTGDIDRHSAHAVVLCTGGYGNVYFLSTNAMGSNASAAWKIHKKGALFANPCYVQIHPTCIPVHGTNQSKLTLMSESLRNSGRIWVPNKKEDAEAIREGKLKPTEIPEEDRDYYLERRYPAFGNLVPRDVASRAAKERCDVGHGIEANDTNEGVYLDFATEIKTKGKQVAFAQGDKDPNDDKTIELGKKWVEEKYGNLFQMYQQITNENPYETPMKIYPAVHYTMGGVWVDYNLQSTIPGCFVAGEANFSDHGANRLGASALMQGLADGYFVVPFTIANYLADDIRTGSISTDSKEFEDAENEVRSQIDTLMNIKGTNSVDYFHKRLGVIMWNKVGMSRNKEGLQSAIEEIQVLREEFWKDVFIPGDADEMNSELEKALRVIDLIELGQLMAVDGLNRKESCGGHFREEYQDEEGETLRDDVNFKYVASWEYVNNDARNSVLHKEELKYESIKIADRNYK